MRKGFIRIFWGLLFVVLDVRFNSLDLLLPDFVGYILIVSGLSYLVPYDKWFRRARVLAFIMIFVSLPNLIEVESMQTPKVKREWTALVTRNLNALLPQQVESARLVRTTRSGDEIDKNRTRNPKRDEDRILGEYSDGTVVLILRYESPEEALAALDHKTGNEYSYRGIRERGETDPSFSAPQITSQHGSTASSETTSAYANVSTGDREIQQWWYHGWSLWNPASWHDKAGWGGTLLYIVEGYSASAEAYKSAFEGVAHTPSGLRLQPLFPIVAVGDVLSTFMILALCAGIIALSVASNNFALMQIAKIRRNIFLGFTIMSWTLAIVGFIAPEFVYGIISAGALLFVLVGGLFAVVSILLIMGLMRKAAAAFGGVGPN